MNKLELAMLAGAYAIRNSKFGKNGGGFVKGVFSPNPEEIRFSEATEILCETADEQNVFTCPVKPGQTVYVFDSDAADSVIKLEVLGITFEKSRYIITCTPWYEFIEDDWLVTLFPTREAAEEKLAEMRGDK